MQEGHLLSRLLKPPPTTRPFFKGQKSKVWSIFLSFVGIPDLNICSVLFTLLLFEFLIKHSIPQTFTLYQDIAISLTTEFLAEFLTFSGHNSINYHAGLLFYIA